MAGIGGAALTEVISEAIGYGLETVAPGVGTVVSNAISLTNAANLGLKQLPSPAIGQYQQQSGALQQAQIQQQYVQQQRALQLEQGYADARSKTEALQAQFKNRQQQRDDLLRRTVAAQRAKFGSMGVGNGGSAAAVLRGFREAAVADSAADLGDTNLGIDDINRTLDYRYRQSLLETQSENDRMKYLRDRLAADQEDAQNQFNLRAVQAGRRMLSGGDGLPLDATSRMLPD